MPMSLYKKGSFEYRLERLIYSFNKTFSRFTITVSYYGGVGRIWTKGGMIIGEGKVTTLKGRKALMDAVKNETRVRLECDRANMVPNAIAKGEILAALTVAIEALEPGGNQLSRDKAIDYLVTFGERLEQSEVVSHAEV